MEFRKVASVLLLVGAALAPLKFGYGSQTPAAAPARPAGQGRAQAAPATKTAAGAQTPANLSQVMRGILFPNSNVIFFAQDTDPAKVKPASDPSVSTDPLTGTFGGWTAVENSALALSEAANLLTMPGRMCSNGRPVPVKDADWIKFVQGLRDAGAVAYQAAEAKSQDKILDASDKITTACSNCHDRYREKPGGVAARCM